MTVAKRRSEILSTETDAITAAIRRAVRDAIEEHYRAGNSITIWRDGKMIEIPPGEIPALLASYDEPAEQWPAANEGGITPPAPANR